MPRVRKPNAEQQTQDRTTAQACALIIDQLASRYPQSVELRTAVHFLGEFAASEVLRPKPRARRPKIVINEAVHNAMTGA